MAKEDHVLEACKLGYQIAASRYDNIYRSIWTIFSYMTAVAAAILSFRAQRFYGEPLTLLASLPLIFWFWTTYLPLNRYGEQALDNLGELEVRITKDTGATLDHFQSFKTKRQGGLRARHAIYFFLFLLHVAFLWSLCATFVKIRAGDRLLKDLPPVTAPAASPGR